LMAMDEMGSYEALPKWEQKAYRSFLSNPKVLETMYEESLAMSESARELKSRRAETDPELPVTVITADMNTVEGWREMQTDLAALTESTTQIIANESTHFVPLDQPGLIVDAALKLVNSYRSREGIDGEDVAGEAEREDTAVDEPRVEREPTGVVVERVESIWGSTKNDEAGATGGDS